MSAIGGMFVALGLLGAAGIIAKAIREHTYYMRTRR